MLFLGNMSLLYEFLVLSHKATAPAQESKAFKWGNGDRLHTWGIPSPILLISQHLQPLPPAGSKHVNQSIGLLLLFLLKCEGLLGLKPRLAELKVPAYTTRAVHIYITKQLVLGPSWFHYLINQLLCCLSFSFEHSIHKRMSKPLSPERKKTFLFPDLNSSP